MKKRKGGNYPKDTVQRHTLPAPKGLIACDVVLDVGPGIRPMEWYRPKHHICIEPYLPYADILDQEARFEVHCLTAAAALQPEVFGDAVEAVYLLDVIEHMEKADGQRIIKMAQEVAKVQVVLYTPYGFMKQDHDAWGLGGHAWQTHRSGWLPEEFAGWRTELYRPGQRMRARPSTDSSKAVGFYASWEA